MACTKQPIELECYIEPVEDAYDYPIKPGSPEWAQLTSSQQMDSVLQIPDDILFSISTEGLVETCLSYPRFGDLYFAEDYQWAFEVLTDHFNGFSELLSRDDAALKLFDRYLLMYPGCSINNWPSINGPGTSTSFSFAYIEIILAQTEILQQLDGAETNLWMQEVITKYKQKKRYNYSVFSKKHTALIAGRIMLLNNYPPFMDEYYNNPYVKAFVDRVMLFGNFETLEVVIKHAVNFLN